MKIALGQMNVQSACCEENFAQMKEMVEAAKKANADIIAFPEMCISGYLLEDKWLDDEYCTYIHSFNERVKALSNGIGIIFGNLYYEPILSIKTGRDGRKSRFNTVLFAYDQKWVKKENQVLNGIHVKHLNPDYRIFDDSRYFLSGIEIAQRAKTENLISPFLFTKEGHTYRIGLEVCEDLWSQDYSIDVTDCYVKQNVDFIVNVSASCWTLNKEQSRHKKVREHTQILHNNMPPFLYVNACGMQNSGKNIVMFDGGSCVYDSQGECVYALNDHFERELAFYDFKSIREKVKSDDKLLEALTKSIYEIDKQMFRSSLKWIIGLSGGIDSSINAALLVKALGKERVIGYNMASAYNSLTTKNNARLLAEALGIEIREGSIEMLDDASIKTIQNYGYNENYSSLVYENIQARIRGHLLSTFASIEGGVIINNANKVEVALGYCTLYGDAIGAMSPLGDLTKVQCFALARSLNRYFEKEVISQTLIPEIVEDEIHWEMPPSAELKEAQLDPMKWYYHDEIVRMLSEYPSAQIEKFMECFLDGSIYETDMGKWIHYYHLEKGDAFIQDLEWLLKTIANAVFKRIQMPPIVLVSRGAYGSDYREAQLGFVQSDKYKHLKAEILKIR